MLNPLKILPKSQSYWGLFTAIALLTLPSWPLPSNAQVETDQPLEISQFENRLRTKNADKVILRHVLTGHTTPIRSLLFSRDSSTLISGGGTNEPFLKFWSVRDGEETDTLRAQSSAILALAMSPNGKVLITSGEDTDLHFWQWPELENKISFFDNYYYVLSLAVTPDSQLVVSGALDGIRVWSLDPPHLLYTLTGFGSRSYALAMHPNAYLLASGDDQGRVRFWNLRERTLISEFSAHDQPISGLAITPDSRSVVTASHDGTVKIWDITTGEMMYTLSGHKGRIEQIALSPDGQVIASASNDGIRLWSVRSGEMLAHLREHKDWVKSLAFSPNGRFLASGGLDRTIYLWEISSTLSDVSTSQN
ncbi:WD-40 repeat protein [Rippkaea orientalis PCC 8801]|uniref:WD-40 repeat protein n=1 Tax=Rippkaea orientalis (strain PCC 8801 / RF-1) TaxID=41431 RepID=B7JXK2_RIPO1|nr:WD40 repeat domain-containing protein [Rippkaea orientalis]ACK64759.1 WD-40 repeat protein [Rippkaea orientalis PCC 8801]